MVYGGRPDRSRRSPSSFSGMLITSSWLRGLQLPVTLRRSTEPLNPGYLLRAALACHTGMATFAEAGVSDKPADESAEPKAAG
jgi:hypothetical protein